MKNTQNSQSSQDDLKIKRANFRVIYNPEKSLYQVQEELPYFHFWTKWYTTGWHDGCYDAVWFNEFTYETDSKAVAAMMLLVKAEDERINTEKQKQRKNFENSNFSVIFSEDIINANPEYLL